MKEKVSEWVKRYLPAEILSIIATLGAAWLTFGITHDTLKTALAATWGGNFAYFGYIFVSDVKVSIKKCRSNNLPYTRKNVVANAKALAVEFGIAEVFDSFIIRPTLMVYIPIWLGNLSLGILVAKIVADITFYIPAIIGYEMFKKHLDK